jgi:XTP/dITP diphosphohydrolase
MTQRLILASNNAGKLKEFNELLSTVGFEVHAQGEYDVPEADEPFHTFVENALQKARHASRLTGLPALADDSGVCVNALGGAPGVYSARFAGEPKSDARNNEKMIAELAKHPTDPRTTACWCSCATRRSAAGDRRWPLERRDDRYAAR